MVAGSLSGGIKAAGKKRTLGKVTSLSKSEAEAQLAAILASINGRHSSPSAAVVFDDFVQNTSSILTVKEVADILRCSKAHVHNAILGKVHGLPEFAHPAWPTSII